MEGTGHWLQLDAPERVNAIVDDFLAEVDSGEGKVQPATSSDNQSAADR